MPKQEERPVVHEQVGPSERANNELILLVEDGINIIARAWPISTRR